MPSWLKPEYLAEVAVYAFLGVALFMFLFWLVDKLTPGSMWDEIMQKNNTALAILMGSCAIALGMIVSAAIHG
jgi:uncharacterized membrane protein YjfL (UPF0719 family)